MSNESRILELARGNGFIRPRDVEGIGIPREYLLRLYRKGIVTRIERGLYVLPGFVKSESFPLAEVSKRAPNAVIGLISALQFHHLTTQIAHQVWIAIENKKWKPTFAYPPTRIVYLSGQAFSFGIQEHNIEQVTVKIYNPAKTVADCFKFRKKIGIDVALEALKDTLQNRKATVDELWKAAKVCRVTNVIRPYLEALA